MALRLRFGKQERLRKCDWWWKMYWSLPDLWSLTHNQENVKSKSAHSGWWNFWLKRIQYLFKNLWWWNSIKTQTMLKHWNSKWRGIIPRKEEQKKSTLTQRMQINMFEESFWCLLSCMQFSKSNKLFTSRSSSNLFTLVKFYVHVVNLTWFRHMFLVFLLKRTPPYQYIRPLERVPMSWALLPVWIPQNSAQLT